MAATKNPATGLWEDENGNPVPAPAGPAPAATTAPATPATPVVQPLFGPKPEHESTTVLEGKVGMSPEAQEARRRATIAEGEVANAREAVTGANVAGAQVAANEATAVADALQRQRREQADRDKEEQTQRDQFIADQKAGVAEEVEKKRKAGAARADFWDGNAAGKVAVSIFRGIQEGIQSFRGGSGPTSAERTVEAAMDAHEKKLVGEWESSAEARRLKKDNYAEWEKGVALARTAAANQSAAEIGVIRAKAESFAKQLDPEKQRAVGELTGKLEELSNRRADQKYGETFDKAVKSSVTNRSPTASAGAASAAAQLNKTTVLDFEGTPVGKAPNEQQADKLAEQRRAIVKAGVLRKRLAELAPELTAADRISNMVLKDKLQQEFDSTLYDLGSQVSVANGQASMTGPERKDFLEQNGRGWFEGGDEFAKLQAAKQKQAEQQYMKQAKSSVIGGVAEPKEGGGSTRDKAAANMGIKAAPSTLEGVPRDRLERGLARAKAANDAQAIAEFEAALKAN